MTRDQPCTLKDQIVHMANEIKRRAEKRLGPIPPECKKHVDRLTGGELDFQTTLMVNGALERAIRVGNYRPLMELVT